MFASTLSLSPLCERQPVGKQLHCPIIHSLLVVDAIIRLPSTPLSHTADTSAANGHGADRTESACEVSVDSTRFRSASSSQAKHDEGAHLGRGHLPQVYQPRHPPPLPSAQQRPLHRLIVLRRQRIRHVRSLRLGEQ